MRSHARARPCLRTALGWLVATVPSAGWALGLGPVSVDSALNQPLRARVELVAARPAELEGLQVGLADAALFERAGVARDRLLLGLRFEVVQGAGGAYVRISSADPVREPALRFVLQAAWRGGRAVRTYSVLLGVR